MTIMLAANSIFLISLSFFENLTQSSAGAGCFALRCN
jgi:hypothetical protein